MSAGANVKAVQRLLGHASATITLDIYASLFGDDLDQVALFDSTLLHQDYLGTEGRKIVELERAKGV